MSRVTIQDAAKLLDIPEQHLRVALQQGKFSSFGHAIKSSEKRYAYYINRERLYKYLNCE